MRGTIAIVGRPNVGKSALFNRIIGRRVAIVHDEPGVTRDRIMADAEWKGHRFTMIDTGGIGLLKGEASGDEITNAALKQVELAVESSQLVLLVVNCVEGVVALDREVADRLRRTGKPVCIVANKADNPRLRSEAVDFAALGFDEVIAVSALHGIGIDQLMYTAVSKLAPTASDPSVPTALDPAAIAAPAAPEPSLRLAIVGRPNVGKSSLINALTQSERVVVTPIPGTTRDAIDVPFTVDADGVRQHYVLVDTAGLRKQRRVNDSIEFYSVKRTEEAIERCDLALLVLDAEVGITEQDKKVADKILAENRACIVVVNKWDLFRESVETDRKKQRRLAKAATKEGRHGPKPEEPSLARFGKWVQEQLFFLDYAPVIFTSATQRLQLDRLLEAVRLVGNQWRQTVPTALLNRALQLAIERRQPVSDSGLRLKFFYATQTGTAPPTFLLFVNRDELFSTPYTRYLADELRRAFGYEGCPLVIKARPRPRVELPPKRPQRRSSTSAKRSRKAGNGPRTR